MSAEWFADQMRGLAAGEMPLPNDERDRVFAGLVALAELPEKRPGWHLTVPPRRVRKLRPQGGKRRGNPKPLSGSQRLRFGDLIVHTSHFHRLDPDDGSVTMVDTSGEPAAEPPDWQAALAEACSGAALSVRAWEDRTGFGKARVSTADADGKRRLRSVGDPDPRLNPFVREGHMVHSRGRGEAYPPRILGALRDAGYRVPAWVTPELVALLIEVTGVASGGSGRRSKSDVADLLRNPPDLAPVLRAHIKRTVSVGRARLRIENETIKRLPRK